MQVTLFKKHKNSIGFWKIAVTGSLVGDGIITISHATKLDGKPVVQVETISEGKNIGKANETAPYEQAVLEAESRVRKQLDKGYVKDQKDLKDYPVNALGLPMPVLAKPVEKVKKLDFTHAFVQPKLDGHRCPTIRVGDEIIMYSRQGKLIETLPHIVEELLNTLEDGEQLDGELYHHEMTLQEISSAVKKHQESSFKIQYHVYDAIDKDASFKERFLDRFYTEDSSGCVQAVPTFEIETLEEAWIYFDTYQAAGYEGAILRLGNQGYEIGRRSSNLLKLKSFMDEEFEIIKVSEGTPRNVNGKTFRVGILHCLTNDGKEFTVTAPGTAEDKDYIACNPELPVGDKLTVKFANWTPDGFPFHPVALRFREDV